MHRLLVQLPTQPRRPVVVVARILQDREEGPRRPELQGVARFVAAHAAAVAAAGGVVDCVGFEAANYC